MAKLILLLSLSLAGVSAFAAEGILASDGPALPSQEPVITDILAVPSAPAREKAGASLVISQPVPEPGTLIVLGAAAALGFGRRLKKKA